MTKSLKCTCEGILFFSLLYSLAIVCSTVKMFDISFTKPPSRNSVIILLVYNEDKIIFFLHAIYSEKRKYEKKLWLIYLRSLTYVDIKYMRFCLWKWNWGTDFIFHKTSFGTSKKLESIVNIFVFFIKISCQSKEFPPF